jgi:exosome complex RNA-binding protein Csl4
MSIQIKSDRKETENKTVRFPVDLIARIEEIMREKDVSFSGFVIQACEYVVDELELEKSNNNK